MGCDAMVKETPKINFLLYPLLGIFSLTLFSGLFLAVYYIPTFSQAFSSVEYLNAQVPFGWLIRQLHAAGGSFFLILILISILHILFTGAYKRSGRSSWIASILLLLMAMMTNLTGFLLPLSQSAFWGTVTVLSNFSSIPWIGNFFVDLLRGGKELGGTALIRFYSAHIGISVLTALLLLGVYWKILREKEVDQRHWNPLLFTLIIGLLIATVTFAPHWFSDPLKEVANPMVNPDRVSPPWYFLFFEETLKFFTGTYPVWSGLAMISSILLLFLFPFWDRNPERRLLLRPIILSLGAGFIVVIIYFSLLGTANVRYGESVILPGGSLSPSEIRGAQVFAQRNCAYCHQVFGREGRREGPDMSVVKKRNRSSDWIRRYILNARLYQPGTTMPRYEIPLEDLEALSGYLLSLDSKKGNFKTVDRRQFLEYGPYLFAPGEVQVNPVRRPSTF